MNNIWVRFIHALTFYTRIPGPASMTYSGEQLRRGNAFFPLIGSLVAGVGCCVYYLASQLFNTELAILMSMAATIWLTGCFHEDGFADTCDGFGGGYGPEAILRIMKDSRVGTYASVGLVLLLMTKFYGLLSLSNIFLGLWTGHVVSRLFPLFFMCQMDYVREKNNSKVGQSELALKKRDLMLAIILASLPLFFLPWLQTVTLLVVCGVAYLILKRWFMVQLGGYTGDCLGASQQIFELLIYLTLGATFWTSI